MAELDDLGKLDPAGMILLSDCPAFLCCLIEIGVVAGRTFVPGITCCSGLQILGYSCSFSWCESLETYPCACWATMNPIVSFSAKLLA